MVLFLPDRSVPWVRLMGPSLSNSLQDLVATWPPKNEMNWRCFQRVAVSALQWLCPLRWTRSEEETF